MNDSLALKKHFEWKGKIETKVKVPVDTQEELAIAYTPGVADACVAIKEHPELSFELTGRANTVAVITDGTAILGLGNIGPEAGMPVMEGKCALFKRFGNVDAFPLCLRTTDTEEIIKTIKYLEGSFGGINLEDIAAPRCFEIETRLKKELDIPVFHDDQHGTAIVVGAALINALKVAKKQIGDVKVVVNGAGAAGTAISKYLLFMGAGDVVVCDKFGIINKNDATLSPAHAELAKLTNKENKKGTLSDALVGADVFIGVSAGNVVSEEMVASMASDPIVFAMANPVPEISPEKARNTGALIVGTGSSKYPNQINNALVFPGIFRGALDARASDVNMEMMVAASKGIASAIPDEELTTENIIPKAVDENAHKAVARAVFQAAKDSGVARR
ncbi:MAG: NADP-dependent malic enzyme [Christensenellales bacterium]